MSDKRTFKVEGIYHKGVRQSFDGGRYVSSTPAGAAAKAFTKYCKSKPDKGRCVFIIQMQETTRGSSGKTYRYQVSRKKLDNPITIASTGVSYAYQTVVKSKN